MAAQVQTDSADVKSKESEVKESGDQGDQGDQDEDGEEAAFLSDTKALDTQILSLALPALIALCAEPVLSIIDTGFVGRLPNAPLCLGGLGSLVAS
jgi:Na+-driven multidrug efflux pump